ncbi:MAG: hypothetical protein ACOH13_11155 [Flavobacteriales bacterium]
MKRTTIVRAVLFPVLMLVLAVVNYMNLVGSELVRPILVLSLVGIGVILGVLLRNIFGLVRKGSGAVRSEQRGV